MSNNSLIDSAEWTALGAHYDALSNTRIETLFDNDTERFGHFSASLDGLLFDYSKTLTNTDTIDALVALAKACGVEKNRDDMFNGAKVNTSEDRAVLHMALRGSTDDALEMDGENVSAFVADSLSRIEELSDEIRSDKSITDIVNIGIGGSDLGPKVVCEALLPFSNGPRVHFVSNIDGEHLAQTLKDLKAESTAIVIASKTFTTLETMTNARSALDWLGDAPKRVFAITENEQAASDLGVLDDHILPLREWIGGRYSLWSGIGLSIAIAIGYENFTQLLAGAHAMDRHFKSADLTENIPVLMAMIGVWHRNFCGYGAQAILPYAQNLSGFPAYIQQLDMESNGKSVDHTGERVDYATGPIVFGEPGTDGQHAFFQLLHQGQEIVPCDFIMALNPEHNLKGHHEHLIANAVAQSEALLRGAANSDNPHRHFEGNRPSVSVILSRLDPYHLGMLLALYEHKIYVQGIIWNINSFDQWGVELGKVIAKDVSETLDNKDNIEKLSPSSKGVMGYILRNS